MNFGVFVDSVLTDRDLLQGYCSDKTLWLLRLGLKLFHRDFPYYIVYKRIVERDIRKSHVNYKKRRGSVLNARQK